MSLQEQLPDDLPQEHLETLRQVWSERADLSERDGDHAEAERSRVKLAEIREHERKRLDAQARRRNWSDDDFQHCRDRD